MEGDGLRAGEARGAGGARETRGVGSRPVARQRARIRRCPRYGGRLGHATRPSEAAARAEVRRHLQNALDRMDPLDREVLALRHFEQLTPAEAAEVLGISPKAAGMRYLRALRRLKDILRGLPGGPLEL